jgi:hypothetical protein
MEAHTLQLMTIPVLSGPLPPFLEVERGPAVSCNPRAFLRCATPTMNDRAFANLHAPDDCS